MTSVWTDSDDLPSPWHEGELVLQRRLNVAAKMDKVGRTVLRPVLVDQHRDFFAGLPSVVIGAVDPAGDAWATMRAGHPGFLVSPDPHTLRVGATRDPGDPAERGLEDGDAVALLGLDPTTRRRNRLNGTIQRSDAGSFAVTVEQSFGNCPQYIHRREAIFVRDATEPGTAQADELDGLDDAARGIIARADTFFVASYVDLVGAGSRAGRQVDVSHRGGDAGFVHVVDGELVVPDYRGNRFFNTLGNIVLNPKVGLLFVDYATGDLLQMTGDATLMPEPLAGYAGAERLWRFRPRRVIRRLAALPLRWTTLDKTS